MRTIYRIAVQSQYTRASLDHAQPESAGRSYCDRSTSCATADRQQTDCTAIKKSQWGILNIPNSALRLKWLQRPYGDLCHRPRPHCDGTGTALRLYCDLPRFGLKIGRSTVAVRSQPRC